MASLRDRAKLALDALMGRQEVKSGGSEEKEIPPSVLGSVGGVSGYTSYSPRTVLNVTTIGYLNNITVYRGVSVLAQSIAGLKWYVKKRYGKQERVEMHPMELLLERPSLKKSRAVFMEQLVSYMLIGGTNYLYRVMANDGKVPIGLYNLRPDLLAPIMDSDGNVREYQYSTGVGVVAYPENLVKVFAFFNPLDELAGLSPLQVAAAVIERQNAGEQWNFSLMSNMARPSGAFVSTVDLPPMTRGKIVREIQKKYGRGKETAGMPLLLENGLTYVQLGLSPIDADWFNSDNSAGRKILAALGVDSLLVNDKQYSTYNNVAEAKLAMWELTGLPLVDRLEDEFNIWLPRFYGDDVMAVVDRTPIELLKRNRAADTAVVIDMWNNGLTPFNSAASMLDQPQVADGDDFYKFGPTLFVRKSEVTNWLDMQEERRNAPPVIGPPLNTVVSADNKPPLQLPPGKSEKKKDFAIREKYTPLVKGAMQKYFGEEEKRILGAFQERMDGQVALHQAMQVLDTQKIRTVLAEYYVEISDVAAQEIAEEFGVKTIQYKQAAIGEVAKQIEYDGDTIVATTINDLSSFAQVGDGYELKRKIQELYSGYKENRAGVIGANLTVLAHQMGGFLAVRELGIPVMKMWNTFHDGLVRPWHEEMEGEERGLEEVFFVDGEPLLYPHDVLRGASASNTINCRCYLTYRVNMKFNPYHDPRTGQFTSGSAVGSQLAESLAANEGFTYNPFTRKAPSTGLALSIYPEESKIIDARTIQGRDIFEYVHSHAKILQESGNYCGAWWDKQSGKVFLDISKVVDDPKIAEELCRQHGQRAYFDLGKMEEVRVLSEEEAHKSAKKTKVELIIIPGDVTEQEADEIAKRIRDGQAAYDNQKFNPYHDHLGRFTSGSGLALNPPGQPSLPGLDDISLLNPNAFRQPHLMPYANQYGSYTTLIGQMGGMVDSLPVSALASLGQLEKMKQFGPDEGDNPRFTSVVNGQTYFVKRLEGRVAGGSPDDFVTNEIAARDIAVKLGLHEQTVPVASFVGEDGASYLTQPFMRGRKDAYSLEEDGYSTSDMVANLSSTGATKMVAYEALIGTADRHGGQYLIDPKSKNPFLLIDFDYGFPTHSGIDRPSWLMDEVNGYKLDMGAFSDMAKKKRDVLAGLQSSGLSSDQLDALGARFDRMTDFVKKYKNKKDVTIGQYIEEVW